LAYHFHWSYEDVMLMEHAERQEWVAEAARINTRLNEAVSADQARPAEEALSE
jgi:hypothetical protein